jgi:hypothetical protein
MKINAPIDDEDSSSGSKLPQGGDKVRLSAPAVAAKSAPAVAAKSLPAAAASKVSMVLHFQGTDFH